MDSSTKQVAEEQEEAHVKIVRLAAFDHDAPLSEEAAQQLIQMASDPKVQAHKGKELETISEAELLARLG